MKIAPFPTLIQLLTTDLQALLRLPGKSQEHVSSCVPGCALWCDEGLELRARVRVSGLRPQWVQTRLGLTRGLEEGGLCYSLRHGVGSGALQGPG